MTQPCSESRDEVPGAEILARSLAPGRGVGSVLSVYRNGPWKLLRRDAAESANLTRDHYGATGALRSGQAVSGEIWTMDGSASPRRFWLFHRLQLASSAAAVGARKKYSLAHRNRNISDLPHSSAIGFVYAPSSRTMAVQSRVRLKLIPDFYPGNCDRNRSACAGGSHPNSAGGWDEVSGFS